MKAIQYIIEGFASLTNIDGLRSNQILQKSDEENLASDWLAVGSYIQSAMNKYSQAYGRQESSRQCN